MTAVARIIDANANRAREALRVMEDAARFGLNDGELSGRLKGLRHDLRPALAALGESAGLDPGVLIASRDTEGDVGTRISTEAEGRRSGLRDVAAAAGARLGEALRSMEEAAKAAGADASGLEALRYRGYTAEKMLLAAFGTGRAVQWRLCVLLTDSLCAGRGWERVASEAIDGGADCLQLREKELEGRELLRRARRLVQMAHPRGVAVVVNDRLDIALLAGADGVHVGQDDLSVEDVRRLAGRRLLVGVSTANMEQARAAARAGADYCGVGPMFATMTKHKPVLSGPAYLREYLADPLTARVPHLAIGGIAVGNVGELVAAGCLGIAVSSAVCGADDPRDACARLRRVADRGRSEPITRG
jgi:thiamine-phosphate pyrophosphorylase